MVTLLLVLLLLILLFGGLGVFVARVFLLGLLIALLVGVVAGYSGWHRRRV
ncbi:MAG TPA: hydrophobic protein [Dehalococcoidia bacterium]|nr:hydrophobic protein [Dehalococcoidia bacterium]